MQLYFEITAVGYKNNLTFTYKEAENTFELNTSSKTLYTKGSTKTTLKVTTNLTDKITWKSSNTKVAAVNSKGVVTAKAKGTAVITASCGEYKVTCKITVKNPSLKLSKDFSNCKSWKNNKDFRKGNSIRKGYLQVQQQQDCNSKLQRRCKRKEKRYCQNHSNLQWC